MLAAKLANLPQEAGVYLMKDDRGQVLYVGKAKNLKARVSSYFRASGQEHPKTQALVKEIRDFEVLIVGSEVEALLLERTLIKHQKPPYNILLRDDKEYPLLRIDFQSKWPRIEKVRRRKEDGALYLGPYGNGSQLNLILAAAYKIFPLIRCSEYEFDHAKRPCNYYHMKQCLGPCTLPVDPLDYRQMIENAIAFLQGKNQAVMQELKAKMQDASNRENYELAALCRDQLTALKELNQDTIVVVGDLKDADVIGIASEAEQICFEVLLIRDYKLSGNDCFFLEFPIQTLAEGLRDFLMQYYDKHDTPTEIFLPFACSDLEALPEALTKKPRKPRMQIPQVGKKKKLVGMANRNARYGLDEFLREKGRSELGLQALQKALKLTKLPRVIECIDISHFQGTANVAAMVCFIDGKPAKSRYRKYNLEDETTPDDFSSIRSVLMRRFERAVQEDDLPDLLVIDGGKGQLSAALQARAEALHGPEDAAQKLAQLPIVGLAKSRLDRVLTDKEKNPVHSPERVFLTDTPLPVELEPGSLSYRILTHLRDETHRFAITHHRTRRKKVRHSSLLEEVKGIGPALRKRLYEQFRDLDGLRAASLEDLQTVKGLSAEAAEELFARLKDQPAR